MPTYQYACTDAECGHAFEQFQAFTDAPLTECPQCGHRLRKVYGSVGVVFKGSGFYRNDSRDSKTSTTPAASSESKGGDASDSGKKSESAKPAAAAPAASSSGGSGSTPAAAAS